MTELSWFANTCVAIVVTLIMTQAIIDCYAPTYDTAFEIMPLELRDKIYLSQIESFSS